MDIKKFPNLVDGDRVSDLQVMKSGAGYYIDRSYWDEEFGFEGPYSRESGYFPTYEAAEIELDLNNWEVRRCIENEWAYDRGDLPDPEDYR